VKKASKTTKASAMEGEGSRTGTRAYNAGLAKSVKEGHSAELGEKARKALEGPEGDALRAAEKAAKAGETRRTRKG
jgi:hypothetical protein